MRTRFLLVVLVVSVPSVGWGIENLASKAAISASGRRDAGYDSRFVADGEIPNAGSKDERLEVWCLRQHIAKDAWLSFQWQEPVEIASVVYWGRSTSDHDNFSSCKVFLDGDREAIASVPLAKGTQAQVIALPRKVTARSMRLVEQVYRAAGSGEDQ